MWQRNATRWLKGGGHDQSKNETSDDRRKYDRAKGAHAAPSVAGERVRVAHIVRGVVDDFDMGEADHANDEEAEHHRHRPGKDARPARRSMPSSPGGSIEFGS